MFLCRRWGTAFIGLTCLCMQSRAITLDDIPAAGAFDELAETLEQRQTVCTFDLQGSSQGMAAEVSTASLNPGSGTLQDARIKCEGGSGALTLYGGPALAPFALNFSGVDYQQMIAMPGASMVIRGQSLSIEDSIFSGLDARGLAVISFVNSNVTIRNATFSDGSNSAAGAIYANETSDVTILDSVFQNNVGGQGGAVSIWNSTVLINGTTFSGNIGDGQGGGLTVYNGSIVVLLDSIFTENSANNGGGAYVETCESSIYSGNTFTGNTATHAGGGLFQIKCSGELQNNVFESNKGTNGPGVWQNDCEKVIHIDNQFVSNVGTIGSGGLEMNQGSAAISGCTFLKGTGAKGGGIYMQDIEGNIADCIFEGNAVTEFGGGIFRGTGTGDISGCEFLSNTAKRSGGAIYDSHVSGDIGANRFSRNKGGRDGSVIFRTESLGAVKSDNKGLPVSATAVHVDNSGTAGEDPTGGTDGDSAGDAAGDPGETSEDAGAAASTGETDGA